MGENCLLEELSWDHARPLILKFNPELAGVIDKMTLSNKHTLFRARYPFGSHILKQGKLFIPNNHGKIVPIDDPSIPNKLRDNLEYSGSLPLGMLVYNTMESYIDISSRNVPFILMDPGKLFALWRVLDPSHASTAWSLSAGAHSLLMVPKISDEIAHRRLVKEFYLDSSAPKQLGSHSQVFTELANHPNFPDHNWHIEVIFFPKIWIEKSNDLNWIAFHDFLVTMAWNGGQFSRNKILYDLIFSQSQVVKNLRPNPYLIDTIKHIIAIGMGAMPGFCFATDDTVGPIASFEKVYNTIYGLKYAPAIMRPYHFNMYLEGLIMVYYSLNFPVAIETSPRSRKAPNVLQDLHDCSRIIQWFLADLTKGKYELENTPIFHLAERVQFDFLHSEEDKLNKIITSSTIPNTDLLFQEVNKRNGNKPFCEISPFFRGCIRISTKHSDKKS
jgi:hypothetical protein